MTYSNGRLYYGGGGTGPSDSYSDYYSWATGEGSWTTEASSPNAHRQFDSAASVGDYNFVVASYGGGTSTDVYHEPTNVWSNGAAWPGTSGDSTSCIGCNSKMYCNGGSDSGVIRIYDQPTNTWSTTAAFPPNTLSNRITRCALDRFLYVFPYGPDVEFWRYDTALDTWTQLGDAPGDLRSDMVVNYADGYFTLFSGNGASPATVRKYIP